MTVPAVLSPTKIIASALHVVLVMLVIRAMTLAHNHDQQGVEPGSSNLLRLAFVTIVVLMHAATTIDKSWGIIFTRFNSLAAGVLLPTLMDELHALHDGEYARKRTVSGFSEVIPFIVLFNYLMSESPATEAKYKQSAKRARMALLALNLGLISQYAKLSSSSLAASLGFLAFQWPVGILREMCSLSIFEDLLLSTTSGFALNSLSLYRASSPPSADSAFSVEFTMNVVIIAAITALGGTMLASVYACESVGRMKKSAIYIGLLAVCGAMLLQTCVLFEESNVTVVVKAVRWLVDFIHTDEMAPLRVSGMWVGTIAIFFGLADHVSGPNVRVLDMPQEFMTLEGKYETRTEKFCMVDFEKPKMSQVSSRKIFHLLMVVILTPPLYLWSYDAVLLAYTVLALGGVLVLFILLELLRARYTQMPVKHRPSYMATMAIYFDRFAGPKRRWGNEIVVRGRDYIGGIDEIQRLESAPGWRKWQCTKDHFSLLLGCAIPVWFYTSLHVGGFRSVLLPLMGCVTVGLGDAVSAVVGSAIGRIKWAPAESGRTAEGSVAGLAASTLLVTIPFLTKFVFSLTGTEAPLLEAGLSMDKLGAALVAATMSAALEAVATDNDNLLLSLFSCVAYTTLLLVM